MGRPKPSAPQPEGSFAPSSPRRDPSGADGLQRESSRPSQQAGGLPPFHLRHQQPADSGQAIYLSNDDTMSLSSAQRVIWALENDAPLPIEHVRPHEMLNYFSFDTARPRDGNVFAVGASLAPSDAGARLALSIAGRTVDRASRRPVNLAYVLDRSGSMQQDGRMSYLKQGLRRSLQELKHGDIVHVTLFDTQACQLVKNFVVGRDSMPLLESLIDRVVPAGSTNLYDGLSAGYEAADDAYVPGYSNRVVLVTDAETNTGATDPRLIAEVGRHYDRRRIRLSGIGVGQTVGDALLDELTERGRGAYVFLGDPAEVDAIFGSRFVSLIETVATDVHLRLHLPPSLQMQAFFGEEASEQKGRVQAIHYFAGTDQLFLSDLSLPEGSVRHDDDLMVTVEYEDPESGLAESADFVFRVGEIWGRSANLEKASFISDFSQTLLDLTDSSRSPVAGRPTDAALCQQRYDEAMSELAHVGQDPEVQKVDRLFRRFCDRFGTEVGRPSFPSDPIRHNDFSPRDLWPGAQSRTVQHQK